MTTRPLWPRETQRPAGDAVPADAALADPEVRRAWGGHVTALREELASEMPGRAAPGDAVSGYQPPPLAHGEEARAAYDDALDERIRTMTMAERVWLEVGISERRAGGFSFDYDALSYERAVTYDPLPVGIADDGLDNWGRGLPQPAPALVRSRNWYK